MFCPRCGKQLPDDSKFCSRCGKNLATNIKQNPDSSVKSKVVSKPTRNINNRSKPNKTKVTTSHYNLRADVPEIKILTAPWNWSEVSAKNIAHYKMNMGFTDLTSNIVKGAAISGKKVTPESLNSIFVVRYLLKHLGHTAAMNLILSFENDGLLIIGLHTKHVVSGFGKDRSSYTQYSFSKDNYFIPKKSIQAVKFVNKHVFAYLSVKHDQGTDTFIIPRAWDAKVFQIKNFKSLDYLVNRLQH